MDRPLHPDDIVCSKANDERLAVVERTHADVDTHEPFPGRSETGAIKHAKDITPAVFKRFMKDGVPPKGTVLVRWTHVTYAELISVSKLTLLDRDLLIGDVVKRNDQDAMSGVVLNTFATCTLQPVGDVEYRGSAPLKGLLPPTTELNPGFKHVDSPAPLRDIPASELAYAETPTEGDLFIYRDWIGRMEAVTYNITLKLSNGTAVEIGDEQAEHADGAIDTFTVGDIAMTKKGHLRTGNWIFGQYHPNTHPVGTVVQTRAVGAEVSWLQRRIGSPSVAEPPSMLEREELDSDAFMVYDRTRRPPKQLPPNTAQQTETTSNSEIDVRLRLKVRFIDQSGACVKYDGTTTHGKLPGLKRTDTLGYDINVFDILSFRTNVTVQWQDQSISRESSIDLIPDTSIDDEHAVWPGEIAHTLDVAPVAGLPGVEKPSKVGVVQSVKAAERMARVLWCPSAVIQYSTDPEEETGLKSLVTGAMGSTRGETEEVSLYDVEAPAAMNVRRGDIALIANQTWTTDSGAPGPENREWLGEIVDTCLDGTLVVRLGAASVVQDVKLRREDVVVVVRSDGTEESNEWADEEFIDDMVEGPEIGLDDSGNLVWNGPARPDGEYDRLDDMYDDGSLGDEDDDLDPEPIARYEDENGESMDEDEVENEEWESEDEGEDVLMGNADQHLPPPSQSQTSAGHGGGVLVTPATNHTPEPSHTMLEAPPAYAVLDQPVPTSQHYATTPPTESLTHLKRLTKEHRILQKPSAIPPGVYVRTWDSRLDLLRVLFIGPSETPYDSAPFVVDFYFPPQFPQEPPRAFFHSWAGESAMGGVGRVNPNLYEDGNICLSILGTWEGSKGEGWDAGRSTVLQVIVSLLGLVLVKEPYFNEAGYEHLAELEASKRPSALYSERTYLRAKGFAITALARLAGSNSDKASGLEGLESIIRWSYTSPGGPRLIDKLVKDVEHVLGRSDQSTQEYDGLTIMSKGACIPLRRVLERLKQLQQ